MSELFYRYANSHIYDIYAVLTGTVTFLCMLLLKKPVKRATARLAERMASGAAGQETQEAQQPERTQQAENIASGTAERTPQAGRMSEKERQVYKCRRRLNMLLLLMTEAVGAVLFLLCAVCFGQVRFSWGSALLAGVVAIAEYAVAEQLS